MAVFASAAQKDMDILEQEGLLIPGSRANLAENGGGPGAADANGSESGRFCGPG